ncbi:hypothetical protein [Raoultibacter phocaeensis]|uniref:hypothetical protein n=1 Tax=Raoultibacter phocaeensis TaxID=2479841 RepID=UPI001118B95D|nr:hypothetical protein [Raoultibacter phocaeensis]
MNAPKKIIALVLCACALCCVLGACGAGPDDSQETDEQAEKQSSVEYVVAEEVQQYSQGELKGASYRVAVPADTPEDELKAVFADVVAHDGFDVHTVWFYSDARLTDGTAPCDVASAVQEDPGSEPSIVLATDETKAKAQESLAAKG